jgi:hypothetical protein
MRAIELLKKNPIEKVTVQVLNAGEKIKSKDCLKPLSNSNYSFMLYFFILQKNLTRHLPQITYMLRLC